MCTVNHAAFAKPGYLIDTPCESMAPAGALFDRLLAHHKELDLTSDQIRELLTISGEYHAEQGAVRLEFAKVTEQLEIKWGRIDAEFVAARKALLDQHQELFRRDEEGACGRPYPGTINSSSRPQPVRQLRSSSGERTC
ncbi:hypothetical protein ABR738_01125 [Streptomyces sp. Edi4]|uniref:hypothetical protein n=1 Tax=Streptomyces sp. Edi4 TaxID=3162527 RepID=UPI00330571E4